MIADHPYVSCILALFAGVTIGWVASFVAASLIVDTAADDSDEITGIGA